MSGIRCLMLAGTDLKLCSCGFGADSPGKRIYHVGTGTHGREFHYCLPRRNLSDSDMDALVTYLRSL